MAIPENQRVVIYVYDPADGLEAIRLPATETFIYEFNDDAEPGSARLVEVRRERSCPDLDAGKGEGDVLAMN